MWDWVLSIFLAILAYFGFGTAAASSSGCAGLIPAVPSSRPFAVNPPSVPQSREPKLLASSIEPDAETIRVGQAICVRAQTDRPTYEVKPVVYIEDLNDSAATRCQLAQLNDTGEQGDLAAYDGFWTVQLLWPAEFGPGDYFVNLELQYNSDEYKPRCGFDANLKVLPPE
jgi:hypothetical protein